MATGHTRERVPAAEVIAALCLGTDLGMGFPFEHGLHTTMIAMRLAERLEVGRETASQTYYASLLAHAGCTTDAHVTVEVFGGSLTTHLNPVIYASGREVMGALLRALPDPGRPAAVRAIQTARRLPRMALAQRPQLTAHCEVAQMRRTGADIRFLTFGARVAFVGLPTTVFIDATGKVTAVHIGQYTDAALARDIERHALRGRG